MRTESNSIQGMQPKTKKKDTFSEIFNVSSDISLANHNSSMDAFYSFSGISKVMTPHLLDDVCYLISHWIEIHTVTRAFCSLLLLLLQSASIHPLITTSAKNKKNKRELVL